MEKLSKLIMRLLDRTRKGLVDWRPTASDDQFQISLADNTVRIAQSDPLGGSAEGDYYIVILNSDGSVIELASDPDLDRSLQRSEKTRYQLMKELFELARRKALKIDGTLDHLLSASPARHHGFALPCRCGAYW